jgi:2-dehydropantoate 2-reductase
MGGVGYVASHVARPGVIHQKGTIQRMVLSASTTGGGSARAESLLAAALAGGIQAELSTDFRRAIWEKYVFLVGLSGTTRRCAGASA